MTPSSLAFLARHRAALGARNAPRRLTWFAPSQRTAVIESFDPSVEAWTVEPPHRKFLSIAARHRAAPDAEDGFFLAYDFAGLVRDRRAGVAPRVIRPVAIGDDGRSVTALGPPVPNDLAGRARAVDPAEAARQGYDLIPADRAYVLLVSAERNALSLALDPARNPFLFDAVPLCALLGERVPATADAARARAAPQPSIRLDPDQEGAYRAILGGSDLAVTGPPGSGKSQVIAAVAAGAATGLRMLVTSSEPSALDAIRRRVAGRRLDADVLIATPTEAAAATALDRPFDLVLVDEGSRMDLGTGLSLAARARQMVVFGDPCQLVPDDGGEDLFARAMAAGFATTMLRWQYRSADAKLVAPVNVLVYRQALRVIPSRQVSSSALQLVEHGEARIVEHEGRFANATEADAILDALETHARSAEPRSVAVIAMRRDQTAYLKRRIADAVEAGRFSLGDLNRIPTEPLIVRDADRVQGEERDSVIVSMSLARRAERSIDRFGLLSGRPPLQLINVALTRARRHCAVHCSFRPNDFGRDPLPPEAFALIATLKLLRQVVRTGNEFTPDPALARYAMQRSLQVHHMGIVQGLRADGEDTFRCGVLLTTGLHEPDRWRAIANQLRSKEWLIVEATPEEIAVLDEPGSSLRGRLDDACKATEV